MRKQNGLWRGLISLWLAAALLMAPFAPALAMTLADDTAHAGATVADMASSHAGHGKTHSHAGATGHKDISCGQHDRCSGQCCATCAQCFTATPAVPAMFLAIQSPQLSAVSRLHDRLVVAVHNRPPAV